jgi:hypothetical protein
LRTLFLIAVVTTLNGSSFHSASFAPAISIRKMYPAYRLQYNRLPNYTPRNLDELRERITAEFYRLQKRPDLLKSFFQAHRP